MRTNNFFLQLGFFLFLAGCASSPQKNAISQPSAYFGDIHVQNKLGSEKFKAELSVLNSKLIRLDIKSQFDSPIASAVVSGSQLKYVSYREKGYYVGKPRILKAFPFPIDSENLYRLVSGESFHGQVCDKRKSGVRRCSGQFAEKKYIVEWETNSDAGPLSGRTKTVTVKIPSDGTSVKLCFHQVRRIEPNAERSLTLQVPSDFRKISFK